MMEAMTNRVDNFVQVELQRRQFGNRYTKEGRAGEPIADFQSISLKDYQVYKDNKSGVSISKNLYRRQYIY